MNMNTITWIKSMLERRGVAYEELRDCVAARIEQTAMCGTVGADVPAKVEPPFQWRLSCRSSAGQCRLMHSNKLAKRHGSRWSSRSWSRRSSRAQRRLDRKSVV